MISIELIRSQPDVVREALRKRGEDAPVDEIVQVDARRRSQIAESDQLRARRNEVSRELGRTKERPPELIDEMRAVGSRVKELGTSIKGLEDELHELLLGLPNLPDDSAPVGPDDDANVLLRTVGEPADLGFEPLPHWELGERLGIIDFARGVKLSGSRFFVLKGKGARLQRALIDWMLDLHTEERGYVELYLPDLVSRDTATASGQLPKFADTMYHDDEDDLVDGADGGGAYRQPVPGRDPGSRRCADELRCPHAMLPAGEGGGGQGDARHQAAAPVREGGAVQVRRA